MIPASLTLNLEELVVETFTTDAAAAEMAKPRTFEPGCTADFCRAAGMR